MPQTSEYLVFGLIAIAVIMGVLVLSMITRWRAMRHELNTLDEQ